MVKEKNLKSNEKLLKEIKIQKDRRIHETDYRMFYAYKSSVFENISKQVEFEGEKVKMLIQMRLKKMLQVLQVTVLLEFAILTYDVVYYTTL